VFISNMLTACISIFYDQDSVFQEGKCSVSNGITENRVKIHTWCVELMLSQAFLPLKKTSRMKIGRHKTKLSINLVICREQGN